MKSSYSDHTSFIARISAITIACCLLIGLYWYVARKTEDVEQTKPWTTIFVHGSFNFPLALLNVMSLFSDNVENTAYAHIIAKLRMQDYFKQEQPILNLGLEPVTPTFTCTDNEYKYAVYPLLQCYAALEQKVWSLTAATDSFYTFGWSGLLSQRQRRIEAVRLYNALLPLHQTKIRLIAHSHGGNVCLNLAAINKARAILSTWNDTDIATFLTQPKPTPYAETCAAFVHYLQTLPAKSVAGIEAQQQHDYRPEGPYLIIDELITLGTPLQQETIACYFDESFKATTNVYSLQDNVQGSDRISTRYDTCQQYLAQPSESDSLHGRNICVSVHRPVHANSTTAKQSFSWIRQFWHFITAADDTNETQSLDPTHKDLWFLGWNSEYCQTKSPLYPLPIVSILPLIMHGAAQAAVRDIDANIQLSATQFTIECYEHQQAYYLGNVEISRSFFDELYARTMQWKPSILSKEHAFQVIHANL